MDTNMIIFSNKWSVINCDDQKKISGEGALVYPPLFCLNTWTKSVPFCVIYLSLILPIK